MLSMKDERLKELALAARPYWESRAETRHTQDFYSAANPQRLINLLAQMDSMQVKMNSMQAVLSDVAVLRYGLEKLQRQHDVDDDWKTRARNALFALDGVSK